MQKINHPLYAAYCAQASKKSKPRLDKAGNPIEFRLTFDEWLKIWEDSGHLADRGRGVGKYCMSRYDDLGHYEVGNVFIQLFSKNSSDNAKTLKCFTAGILKGPRTVESKLAVSRGRMKVKLTLDDIDKIRLAKQNAPKGGSGYGICAYRQQVADAFSVSQTTVRRIWDEKYEIEEILRNAQD